MIITVTKYLLFFLGITAILIALFALSALIRRARKQALQSPSRATQTDLAHMIILLQTMRDILEEQKRVAKQINDHIDNKIAQINTLVEEAIKNVRELRTLLPQNAQVERPNASGFGNQLSSPKPAQAPTVPGLEKDIPTRSKPQEDIARSELQAVAKPAIASAGNGSLLDNWVGIELADDDSEIENINIPEHVPEFTEDPEAARQAFRTLLNITQDKDEKQNTSSLRPGNGRRRSTPLQARVYEYRDAGMTVAQIAKELGIGKGEVRLILSLRKDKG